MLERRSWLESFILKTPKLQEISGPLGIADDDYPFLDYYSKKSHFDTTYSEVKQSVKYYLTSSSLLKLTANQFWATTL